MAIVGLYTAEDLWHKFGDLEMPVVLPTSVSFNNSAIMFGIGLPGYGVSS